VNIFANSDSLDSLEEVLPRQGIQVVGVFIGLNRFGDPGSVVMIRSD